MKYIHENMWTYVRYILHTYNRRQNISIVCARARAQARNFVRVCVRARARARARNCVRGVVCVHACVLQLSSGCCDA